MKSDTLFVDNLLDYKCDLCNYVDTAAHSRGFMVAQAPGRKFCWCTTCVYEMQIMLLSMFMPLQQAADMVMMLVSVYCVTAGVPPEMYMQE